MDNIPTIKVISTIEGSHTMRVFRGKNAPKNEYDFNRIMMCAHDTLESVISEIAKELVIHNVDVLYYALAFYFLNESLVSQLEGEDKEFYDIMRRKMCNTTFVVRKPMSSFKEDTKDD